MIQHYFRRLYNTTSITIIPSWKVIAGFTIVTPTIAIIQGSILLYDYRKNHGNAPRPDMPSRGIVVAQNNKNSTDNKNNNNRRFIKSSLLSSLRRRFTTVVCDSSSSSSNSSRPPLRLLVIGDSLAAGVGTSQSSTPILPQSIAEEISKACNGRAVLWECVGEPGQCANEIINNIHNLDTILPKPIHILHQLKQWQYEQRIIAQQKIKQKTQQFILQRRKTLEQLLEDDNVDNNKNNDNNTNGIIRLWNNLERKIIHTLEITINNNNNNNNNNNDSIDNDKNNINDNDISDNNNNDNDNNNAMIIQQRRGSYINTSDSMIDNGKYDVAIVLTGLNDLKESFLPFMMSAQRAEHLRNNAKKHTNSQDIENDDGLKGQLKQILYALESKMKDILPTNTTADDDSRERKSSKRIISTSSGTDEINDKRTSISHTDERDNNDDDYNHYGPLIVFPALPYEPTVLCQYKPLSWFLIPLLDKMDKNKQIIAELYPDRVLYVKAPNQDVMLKKAKEEQGNKVLSSNTGASIKSKQDYTVLLRINDIAHDVKERIETLMRQHYAEEFVQDNNNKKNEYYDDYLYMYDECFGISMTPIKINININPLSNLVSTDGIHPSDIGYDMWGKHIANAIVQEWEKNKEQQNTKFF